MSRIDDIHPAFLEGWRAAIDTVVTTLERKHPWELHLRGGAEADAATNGHPDILLGLVVAADIVRGMRELAAEVAAKVVQDLRDEEARNSRA